MLTKQNKRTRHRNPQKVVEAFLSTFIEDPDAEMKDRLKASELLSKTAAQAPQPPSQLEIHIDYGTTDA